MSELDVNELLQKHSDENPSGEDLEYDPDFVEMETAAQGKPEQQYGDTIIPAEPPEWKIVEVHARNVLKRSHDLRAATQIANALLVQEGLVEFASVISLIRGMVVDHWETFHPQLDPDDDNDPTIRVNTLMSLCDNATTLEYLTHCPLVSVRAIGQFTLFDWKVASGEIAWPSDSDDPAPEKNLIDAAFQDCELEQLESRLEAARTISTAVREIEDFVTDKVGAAQSCNFEKLAKEVAAILHLLEENHQKRTPMEEPAPVESSDEEGESNGESSNSASAAAAPKRSGFASIQELKITTRQDAIVALDKICEYYDRFEPSSPLPLLLKRARRLSNKSFLEIIKDISPDILHQVESLGGLDDNSVTSSPDSSTESWDDDSAMPESSGDSY